MGCVCRMRRPLWNRASRVIPWRPARSRLPITASSYVDGELDDGRTVDNLFDRAYRDFLDTYKIVTRGPGRNIRLDLTQRFQPTAALAWRLGGAG